jgi:hypothetical protein
MSAHRVKKIDLMYTVRATPHIHCILWMLMQGCTVCMLAWQRIASVPVLHTQSAPAAASMHNMHHAAPAMSQGASRLSKTAHPLQHAVAKLAEQSSKHRAAAAAAGAGEEHW